MRFETPRALALAIGFAGAILLSVVPFAAASQRAYFSDYESGTTAIPGLDVGTDGQLTPTGQPEGSAGSNGLEGMLITRDATRLYAADAGGDVWGFSIDPASGALSALPGSPYNNSEDGSYGISITPDGRFLYTGNEGDFSISGFEVAADGSLTELAESPFELPAHNPAGIAISSDGANLYAADRGGDSVLAFGIETDGGLVELSGSPYSLGDSDPYVVTLSPDGRFLYVPTRVAPHMVHGFAVAADGSLSPLDGSPFPAGGANLFGGTVSPDSRFVYSTSYTTNEVNIQAIGAGGELSQVPGSPFDTPDTPAAPTTTADGGHLVIAHGDDTIGASSYSIAANGVATPVFGSPFLTGVAGDFQSVALTPEQPPVAALDISQDGTSVTLDAGASSDPGGSVVRYDWDFGDGSTLADGGPQVTHTYAEGGSFSPSVTVTDDAGCSTTYLSAGQTAYCNGSGIAEASETIETLPPALTASTKKKQKLGKKAIKVKVECDEPCTIKASGTEKVKGDDGKDKLKLKPKSLTLDGTEEGVLKLKLSKKARRKAKKADSGKAKIKVVATDETGSETDPVKLKAKLK